MNLLIITDPAKTLNEKTKNSSIYEVYSGSFREIKAFHLELENEKIKSFFVQFLNN